MSSAVRIKRAVRCLHGAPISNTDLIDVFEILFHYFINLQGVKYIT